MKKTLRILLLLSLTAVSALFGFNKGGRTAFQFSKIGVGARQAGMGEACIAVVRDVNAVYWNPANISGLSTGQAAFTYTRWFADLNYLSAAVGYRWNRVGIFALSAAALDYEDLQEALVTSPTGAADTRTGSTFTGGDMQFGLTFAREFTDKLAIGLTAKYYREELFTYGTGLMAFDVGTYYNTGFKGFRIAMSAQNFSTGSVSWLGKEKSDRIEGYEMPLIYRIGTSFDLIGGADGFIRLGPSHHLQVSLDAINTNDYGERYHLGAEYWFNRFIALRGGYRFNYEEGNLAIGFGLLPQISSLKLQLDYAYVNYEFLDSPHRFSLLMSF